MSSARERSWRRMQWRAEARYRRGILGDATARLAAIARVAVERAAFEAWMDTGEAHEEASEAVIPFAQDAARAAGVTA